MNRAAYEALPGLRWSVLKHMRRSPLHFRNPPEPPDGDALAIGTVTHILTLEPHRFAAEVAVWEGGTRRGKEWEAFREAAGERAIVKPEALDRCRAMAEAVRTHPVAGPLLVTGVAESPVRWIDEATGIECKALIDWLTPAGALVDLKTARTIDVHRFAASSHSLGYFGQLAFYRRGLAMRTGCAPEQVRALLVAVESAPPHDVAVYEPDEDTMAMADREVGELLARVRQCTDANEWPGAHATAIEPLRAPVYAMDDDYEFTATAEEI